MLIHYLTTEEFQTHLQHIKLSFVSLCKWIICSIVSGILLGFIGSYFHIALSFVTDYRLQHPELLYALPIAGIVIIFLYRILHEEHNKGTNLVIEAIQSGENVPIRVAPLIIISTLITHLFGGSAGREGAALQIGGSIGNFIAKLFHFDEKDTRILIMCGMSACFSALFGTPIAAAIFSMEVISVGIMYYAALVPCVLSALIAARIAHILGLAPTAFAVTEIPELTLTAGIKILIMSLIFALASMLFCIILHQCSFLYQRFFSNTYVRIMIAGLIVIAMRFLFQTTDYLGAGSHIIAQSFVTQCAWYVCLLKMIFTGATLGGGYKGGEIVPTLFIGATLGSFLSSVFGLPVSICAACGTVGVFCGVTNCPITSLLLAIELFGSGSMKFCFIAIAISYLFSGYYSLYKSQRIVYSKYKTTYLK